MTSTKYNNDEIKVYFLTLHFFKYTYFKFRVKYNLQLHN